MPWAGVHAQRHSLNQLAAALTAQGWTVSLRVNGRMPLLRVCAPALPIVGESISVRPRGRSRRLWFYSSNGTPISPCHDLPTAVRQVGELMTPCRLVAERFAQPDKAAEAS
ncbi:hypothetical protein ACQEU3_19815 [Spirillospora sp. CA-253888]